MDKNVRPPCRRRGFVPKNCGVPHVEVAASNTSITLEAQSHVCPPNKYTLPSGPIAAAAFAVAAGKLGSDLNGGDELLNSCDKSREKKSADKEVSESTPPRKYAVLFAYTVACPYRVDGGVVVAAAANIDDARNVNCNGIRNNRLRRFILSILARLIQLMSS